MEKQIQKNFYAIIPAFVRYDKDLQPNAKLLYGEITALSNEKGFCWAENEYFANLYNVSKTSISKWISSLIKKQYITSEIVYKQGTKEIEHRYLRIVGGGIEEKLNTPIEEKLKDNNTNINITFDNNINNKEPKHSFGEYGRVKLTNSEYNKLVNDYGEDKVAEQIKLLDEYVESNNNKNKYSNFNLVLRKSIRENWFNKNEVKSNGSNKRNTKQSNFNEFPTER